MTKKPERQTVSVPGIPSAEAFGQAHVFRNIPFAWMVDGFDAALARLRQAVTQHDEEVAYHALFEALQWAVTALDYLIKRRKVRVDDPVLLGLVLPRNRVHHQWADALERRQVPGPAIRRAQGTSGLTGGGIIADWYWRAADDLPPGDSDRGLREYREHLAGQRVEPTLQHLEGIFQGLRGTVDETPSDQ